MTEPQTNPGERDSHRENSEENHEIANNSHADQQVIFMLYAIWHELRHIGDLIAGMDR